MRKPRDGLSAEDIAKKSPRQLRKYLANLEHRKRNPTYHRDRKRRIRAENPEIQLAIELSAYGITIEEYGSMLSVVPGCAICSRPPPIGSRLQVDHDHVTGRVRGLLCGLCNKGLGSLQDSPALLTLALDYLS